MKRLAAFLLALSGTLATAFADSGLFIRGEPGKAARYVSEKPASLAAFTIAFGKLDSVNGTNVQWLSLSWTKPGGRSFGAWLLTPGYASDSLEEARAKTARYIIQTSNTPPREYRHRATGEAVLPSLGGWRSMLPRPVHEGSPADSTDGFPKSAEYLGHAYRLESVSDAADVKPPGNLRVIELRPDALVGVPSNTRQADEGRHFDGSDYKLTRLTQADYREMADAGMNCFHVDREQLPWIEDLDGFYWGVGGADVPYPECLYDSQYLGYVPFLDEPGVGTRDSDLRPKLAKDPEFKKSITPKDAFDAFRAHFEEASSANPVFASLAGNPDAGPGETWFRPANMFTWESMISTAAYQLHGLPAAFVLEPPGRIGTLRTLPEFDMSYGCQIPINDPRALTDIIYGFLRGAARANNKEWGTSIYGAVDPTDSAFWLTHAYDLGATRFFFWDNGGSACVPYKECLALTRALKARIVSYPVRDLDRLRKAAEVAILLPPGYDLGHVHTGRGDMWGVGELNLERKNAYQRKYREVMGNFFLEIERCLRQGVAFDLMWDLDQGGGVSWTAGYREIVRIREDGSVEVRTGERRMILDRARTPVRPPGEPPDMVVRASAAQGKAPLDVIAEAVVRETTAPVFYTGGADNKGAYHNAVVDWELFGPNEEDYRALTPQGLSPHVVHEGNEFRTKAQFTLSRPGRYRLRAATVDMAGRTAVSWTLIDVAD